MSGFSRFSHTVSNTAPSNPAVGDEWYNPATKVLYKRSVTAAGAVQWIQVIGTDSTATPTNGQVLTWSTTNNQWYPANTTSSSSSVSGSTYTRTTFTATSGQTAFSATYSIGYVQVFLNGVLLAATDYTATDGVTVTLAVAAVAGDVVEVVALSTTGIVGITTGKSIAMSMIFGF